MRWRPWLVLALVAVPFVSVDRAPACIRFKRPQGPVRPPGIPDPKDRPPPSQAPPVDTSGFVAARPTGLPPSQAGTWETWWLLNRVEFLPRRPVLPVVTSEDRARSVVTSMSPEGVRAKLWKPLLTLTRDRVSTVREAALLSLGRVASDDALRAEARATLLPALADRDAHVARAAALGLQYVADPAAEWVMARTACDPKTPSDVRGFLAITLATRGSGLATDVVRRLLANDPKAPEEVRAAAVLALGSVPSAEGRRLLERVYDDRKGSGTELRALAVEAIGRRGSFDEGRELLLRALGEKDVPVRRSAAIALGLLDCRPPVEREVAGLLAPYGPSTGTATPDDVLAEVARLRERAPDELDEAHARGVRDVVRGLVPVLRDDADAFAAGMAAISLGRIAAQSGCVLARMVLASDLRRDRNLVREYEILALAVARAPTAYDVAVDAVTRRGRQPTTRGAAIVALGILGDPRGTAVLRRVLEEEPHASLRGFAALGLGMIGDEVSQGPILSLLKTTKWAGALSDGAIGLALLGRERCAAQLVARLERTENDDALAHAVYALGLMKDRSQVDAILAVTGNASSTAVRGAAVAALGYVCSAEDFPIRHRMSRGFNYTLNQPLLDSYFFKL
jgi:HEAT repeat protein